MDEGVTRFEVKIRRLGDLTAQVGAIGKNSSGHQHRLLDYDEYFMIRVTVNVTGPTVQVEFSHQEKKSTFEYILENRTEHDVIRVRQESIPLMKAQKMSLVQVILRVDFMNNDVWLSKRVSFFLYR